jgi:hypothetical protein
VPIPDDSGIAACDGEDDSEPVEEAMAAPQTGDAKNDDLRAKFKQALDQKHKQQHATAAPAEHDGSEKGHGASGPTKERAFRRKAI